MANKGIKFTGERASLTDIGGINLARYKFALEFCKNRKVLEFGSGSGYGAHYLAENGVKRIVAYDANKKTVEFANINFSNKNLEFRLGKVEDVKLLDKFDVIIAFELIEHLKKTDILLKKTKKSLVNGGLFICSTPNRLLSSYDGSKPSNPYHVIEYSPDELNKVLGEYFRKIYVYGIFLKDNKKGEEEKMQNNWRWKLSSGLAKKRWMRKLVNYLPEKPKRLFTGEKDLMFKSSDFRFSKLKIRKSPYLIAVCTL